MSKKIIKYIKEKINKKEENQIDKKADKFKEIIEYAKEIKEEKENQKKMQEYYLEIVKTGNKEKANTIKNNLWELENKINLSESFLRNKIKEIQISQLKIEEKTELINYICGVAKIKTKKGKNKQNNPLKTEIDNLNIKKEKIISSENITNSQKKIMIEKIDEEIIKLSKEE